MVSKADNSDFAFLGFGSPLLDLSAAVDDDFLSRNVPGGKGGTVHVSGEELRSLIDKLPDKPRHSPGGSAGNTVFALNHLGIRAELFGKVGEDEYGRFYLDKLIQSGASGKYILQAGGTGTGICLALRTPDGERTMRSFLGKSLDINSDDVNAVDFSIFDVVMVEGYMIGSPAFKDLVKKVARDGCRIAFDPGSFELAAVNREFFTNLCREHVDYLLLNHSEAESLCGKKTAEEMLDELGSIVPCVVLKLGADGALIKEGKRRVEIPASPVDKVVDTTAAGDLFAAGFFCGTARGMSLEDAGKLGAEVAAEVIQTAGTELPESKWDFFRKKLCG